MEDFEKRLEAARTGDVPHLYGNSFATSFTSSDVMISIELNGFPQATINLPLGLAKDLGKVLTESFKNFETDLKLSVVSSSDVEKASMANAKTKPAKK